MFSLRTLGGNRRRFLVLFTLNAFGFVVLQRNCSRGGAARADPTCWLGEGLIELIPTVGRCWISLDSLFLYLYLDSLERLSHGLAVSFAYQIVSLRSYLSLFVVGSLLRVYVWISFPLVLFWTLCFCLSWYRGPVATPVKSVSFEFVHLVILFDYLLLCSQNSSFKLIVLIRCFLE